MLSRTVENNLHKCRDISITMTSERNNTKDDRLKDYIQV